MARVHTHYDNLKVTRDAPPEVIRAAYRTLCHKYHPDKNGGSAKATRTFQLINTAYEVLSDPERRRAHDEWIAREEWTEVAFWDGQERRRRSGWSALAARLRNARAMTVVWTSAAVCMVLVALYSV